jgi:hypothetical protein
VVKNKYLNQGRFKLPKQSYKNAFQQFADMDKDGEITEQELVHYEKLIELENEDEKSDAQRKMAWFSLSGMLLYPFAVVAANLLGLDKAPGILGDMAPTYFVSVAAIVAAFYGKEAYVGKKSS